ncbi:DUF1835 domain-containing protein [Pseudorhodoferax sp.]|uniref:DUF1835 domain-containing protein n=1 Tax=Pseudorhodoferax sp. TaxID=1993553 RepID=UPI0039E22FF2
MSTDPSAQHGRIHLDQQRKRAKELLARLRAGTAPEQQALLAQRRRAPAPPQLADAQWLVARSLGFASWPRLKAHVDAIDFAARHPGFAADDEPATWHWRCGNDIAHSLRLAGFRGRFQMFGDPLPMGPAPALPPDAFATLRAGFVHRAFGLPQEEALARMRQEYGALARLHTARRVVLWCEADAYDQLFLVAVLASLAALPERLELIAVDGVPGVRRFIGIGQLAPDLLAWLWPQRRPVTPEALALARDAWAAYRAPSPRDWAALARAGTPALPLLAPALRRQLQELPGLHDGLSLTERLALQIVRELGQPAFGQVFAELHGVREPLPWLGDGMFHALMRPLIDAPNPLLLESDRQLDWPRRPLQLTALGHQVLDGRAYWLDHAAAERWVGGVRLAPRAPHWALDAQGAPCWRASGAACRPA